MDDKCIFCDIAQGKSPADLVYQDDSVVAFYDISPKAPVHILIVPKKHIESTIDLEENDEQLAGHMIRVAKQIADEKDLNENGYRLVFNTGKHSGQVVEHIHLHLIGGRQLGSMA